MRDHRRSRAATARGGGLVSFQHKDNEMSDVTPRRRSTRGRLKATCLTASGAVRVEAQAAGRAAQRANRTGAMHHMLAGDSREDRPRPPVSLSDTDMAILTALCRPYIEGPPEFPAPAPNKRILEELGRIGEDMAEGTLKKHLGTLYVVFGLQGVDNKQKRHRLAELVREYRVIPGWGAGPEPPSDPSTRRPRAHAVVGVAGRDRRNAILTGMPLVLAVGALLLVFGPWPTGPSAAADHG